MSTADELIERARRDTGLSDLGPDTWHEGLVALLEGAEKAGSLNELGVAVLHDQAVGLLRTRLEVEDWYRRHPEIDDQEITAPLFGLGLPRTGSTALSYLLAQDTRSRSLLTWESGQPTPPPTPETYDSDPRIEQAAATIAFLDELAPHFKVMLPMSPTGPNECLQILAIDFRSAVFLALGDNPTYEAWLAECDMTSAYEYHRRVLKLLQWKFPTRPWRLKSPAHMQAIDALVRVYPDARFVMTHRDIAQVIPSVVSLLDSTSELLRSAPLPADFAVRQADYWEQGLRATLAFRDSGQAHRFFDIGFSELRPDPIPAIARLYDWLGVELSDELIGRMRDWGATNPADKHGIHEYRPEQYGIDLAQLRSQFAFYNDRFASGADA